MELLLVIYVLGGLGQAVLAIPMILRKLKPNGLYGFRVRATLENPDLWYEVNAYAGKRLLISGILISASSVGLFFVPGISVDAYALGVLGVVVVALGVTMAQSVRYLSVVQNK